MAFPPRLLTFNGRTLSITEWSKSTGIPIPTIRSRLDRLKWSVRETLTTPINIQFMPNQRKNRFRAKMVPRLEEHPCGQAYVRYSQNGRRRSIYLGPYGSKEADERYQRFAAEWRSSGGYAPPMPLEKVYVANLIERFLGWAESYYRKLDRVTSELYTYLSVLEQLNDVYGAIPVDDFGTVQLRAMQQHFVDRGLARKTVNRYVWKIVKVFQWGVGQSLVDAAKIEPLRYVLPLRRGRTTAPEIPKRRSVPLADVLATIPHLGGGCPNRQRILEAMVNVQRYTGMRPGALTAMRAGDLTEDDHGLLQYSVRIAGDKTAHLNNDDLVIWLGPKAREAIAPLLAGLQPADLVFAFSNRLPSGRVVRKPISRERYCRSIAAACQRANVKVWTPHQLRKTRATEVRKHYGEEFAAIAIDDSIEVAKEYYFDPHHETRKKIAKETG